MFHHHVWLPRLVNNCSTFLHPRQLPQKQGRWSRLCPPARQLSKTIRLPRCEGFTIGCNGLYLQELTNKTSNRRSARPVRRSKHSHNLCSNHDLQISTVALDLRNVVACTELPSACSGSGSAIFPAPLGVDTTGTVPKESDEWKLDSRAPNVERRDEHALESSAWYIMQHVYVYIYICHPEVDRIWWCTKIISF